MFAYIVVMLCIGLLRDWAMLSFKHPFLRWAED